MSSVLTYTDQDIAWCSPSNYIACREHGPSYITLDGRVYFAQIDSRSSNRKYGPAIICPDGELMYQSADSSKLHRTNGPARIWPNGYKDYWVHGKQLTTAEFFLKYGVL